MMTKGERISLALKNYYYKNPRSSLSDSWKKAISKSSRHTKHTDEYKKKMSLIFKGKPMHSDETKKKIGKKSKEFHSSMSVEKKKKWFFKLFSSQKPNGLEKRLIKVFKKNNLPYKYVGDGKIWIVKKNPDFLNTNGKKEVIEANGCYWHGCPKCYPNGGYKGVKDNSKRISSHYRKFGFECKNIWEHDITDMSDEHVLKTLGVS